MDKKSKFEEIAYAGEVQEFINLNEDVKVSDILKQKIKETPKDTLLKVVKIIGSGITIQSVEVYDEEYLLNNF